MDNKGEKLVEQIVNLVPEKDQATVNELIGGLVEFAVSTAVVECFKGIANEDPGYMELLKGFKEEK